MPLPFLPTASNTARPLLPALLPHLVGSAPIGSLAGSALRSSSIALHQSVQFAQAFDSPVPRITGERIDLQDRAFASHSIPRRSVLSPDYSANSTHGSVARSPPRFLSAGS